MPMSVDLDPAQNPLNPFDPAVFMAAGIANQVTQEFFRDFSVSFGQIEDSPGLDEFGKPLIRNLVFTDNMKLDAGFVNEFKFHISETHIETESGWFSKETSIVKGLRSETNGYCLRAKNFFDMK